MRDAFTRAITNIIKHGDTDIFPFPIESHVFFDKQKAVVDLLQEMDADFESALTRYPPSNYSALAPISYTGFRWASQLDAIWNAYFLGLVLSIADEIERARIEKSEAIVFSYRYLWSSETGDIFDKGFNWRAFMEHSLALSQQHKFVVSCDISEFYPRLNHHRLENALRQLHLPGSQPSKIMEFLKNFSGTYSFGIPVGGPASRILSELLLNQIDRLLKSEGITFCRFADDYHLFSATHEDCINNLLSLSEKLGANQGLQLQKAKTRIMSSYEFVTTNPLGQGRHDDDAETATAEAIFPTVPEVAAGNTAQASTESKSVPIHPPQRDIVTDAPELRRQSQNFLRFSIRFDPYSPTADADYAALKAELRKYDIISLLKAELSKSRIHISLSRKIVTAIKFIDEDQRDDAVLSIIANAELLYPIYSNVLLVAKTVFPELKENTQKKIIAALLDLVQKNSHVIRPEVNLAYVVRVLACMQTPETEAALVTIFKQTKSTIIRRDIILVMAKWRAWYWLSNLRPDFRVLTPLERRAFIIASYQMSDEGKHWRSHIQSELSPFELLVRDWAAERSQSETWSIPI